MRRYTRTPSRYRSAFTVTSLALVSAIAFGTSAESPAAARAADAARYAGMPAPVQFALPAAGTTTAASDAYSLSPTTVRLRGMRRIFRIDSTTGTVYRHRWVDFGLLSSFRTTDRPSRFNDRQYAKLTSGRFDGWWVSAPDVLPSGVDAPFAQPLQVKLAAGTRVGVRFYARGRVRTRRALTLSQAAVYPASTQATFSGRTFYRLSDGPLAGRWVAGGSGVTLVSATPTTGPVTTPTPAPTPTPTPAPTNSTTAAATWKGLVLIYRETDVTFTQVNGTSYRLKATMTNTMYDLVKKTMGQAKQSVGTWSDGFAQMNLTFVDVPHPITSLAPLGSEYWVGPQSVKPDLDRYAPTGSYDSIFVIWEPRDAAGVKVPVGGWGLTLPNGTWSNGSGFSSIITPGQLWWWTNSAVPEEMFIHEWMHQVIYFHQKAGRMQLDLHAASKYGYVEVDGTWKTWLRDVMRGRVNDNGTMLGVSRAIWAAGTPTNP
jgi:hypothetical protein